MSNDLSSPFRVDLRLLLEMGERLISRDEVALVELVKNAYDADAETARISVDNDRVGVEDDGTGMSWQEINEGWLTIGTSLKRREPRTDSGRRVLGDKGLGRLALLRLGKMVVIQTQREGNPCYQLTMDWATAKKQLEKNVYTPMERMAVAITRLRKSPFTRGHGTRLVIQDLNNEWDENRVERLKLFLSRLVEPDTTGKQKFNIELFHSGKKIEIAHPLITRKPHYFLEVNVTDSGRLSGVIKWNIERGEGQERIEEHRLGQLIMQDGSGKQWREASEGGSGKFGFKLSVWDLDARELRGHKNVLKQWSGISLLRDGFRVVQPDIDWLGLDLRRVQNPTLRLSTNQIIGSVFISSDNNPLLIDKTDREGVVESEALLLLKGAIYHLMDILERKRYGLRRTKTLSRGLIFSYLDTAPLRYIAKKIPAKQRKGIEDYALQIDAFRGMLEDWILGRDRMATMGMLAARLIHEARSALMKITDNYPLIEKHLVDFGHPLRERLTRMVEGGKMLAKVFMELDPFLKFRGKATQDIVLVQVIDSLEFLFGPELRKNKIDLVKKIPREIVFRANPTDIYVLLANLIDNSIYWLKERENQERTIQVKATEKSGFLEIEVADNGPGLQVEDVGMIFEAGFTTKPGGTELGLSIVKDIVEFYGGTVEAVENGGLGGASFRVRLPVKE